MNHHGVVVDKNKMKCSCCDKLVSHSQRLKSHLASGIGGDLVPREEVPSDVKEVFVNELIEKKKAQLSREVENLDIYFCKRRRCHQQYSNTRDVELEEQEHHISPTNSLQAVAVKGRELAPSRLERALKIIARFIYEPDIDLNPVNLYNVKNTINSIFGCKQMDNNIIMPSYYSMLVGRFLEDEVKQTHKYVNNIKELWRNTSCSILLDGWMDRNGRDLVNILVECPQGPPIYLRSVDISSVGNSNALESCLEEVIADIGVENIVQVITYTASPDMKAVGEKLMEKYQTIFWTVDASHCIELMLEKMQTIDVVNKVLIKARTIIKLIYNCADLLKLMRTHICAHNLVKSSRSKVVECFLTLENILSEEENLKRMFKSSEWITSSEGKEVADMVAGESFWEDAKLVSLGTIPILRVLDLINEKDKIMVCTIYETMNRVIVAMMNELFGQKSQYEQFWCIIAEILENCLHSPLHAAGFALNPNFFFSRDVLAVYDDLIDWMARMKRFETIPEVSEQFLKYVRLRFECQNGGFEEGISSLELHTNILPVEWWLTYGGECTDLQKLAVRILSQTCHGGSRYQLQRTLVEKMLPITKGSICLEQMIEQKLLTDLTFVRFNRTLRNVDILAQEVDALSHHWLSEMELGGDV